MRKSLIALAFGLLVASPAFAADPLPCTVTTGTNPAGGGFPGTVVSADFDGDGIEDRACARLSELDAAGPVNIDVEFGPFTARGDPIGGVATLDEFDNHADFGDKSVSVTAPGAIQSPCARGLGPACRLGEESMIYASNPSVTIGTEGASWMYVYIGRDQADPTRRRFRTFWLSD